ncbi:hypothetical protein [Gottfriedia acidiceleris]|uniref:hypothetical protein n=1 Tax=Gottfriedia acidiceleris TaxID=371036 RepID=UPI000B44D11D|nr:hypothetical protein [Gottfriedia acidiceleris]
MPSDEDFQTLLDDLKFYINSHVRKVTPVNQEDLAQEIKILMYEKFLNINDIISEPPGFFEFIEQKSKNVKQYKG